MIKTDLRWESPIFVTSCRAYAEETLGVQTFLKRLHVCQALWSTLGEEFRLGLGITAIVNRSKVDRVWQSMSNTIHWPSILRSRRILRSYVPTWKRSNWCNVVESNSNARCSNSRWRCGTREQLTFPMSHLVVLSSQNYFSWRSFFEWWNPLCRFHIFLLATVPVTLVVYCLV